MLKSTQIEENIPNGADDIIQVSDKEQEDDVIPVSNIEFSKTEDPAKIYLRTLNKAKNSLMSSPKTKMGDFRLEAKVSKPRKKVAPSELKIHRVSNCGKFQLN